MALYSVSVKRSRAYVEVVKTRAHSFQAAKAKALKIVAKTPIDETAFLPMPEEVIGIAYAAENYK